MGLPKVLIINQPFNNHTGGGITLSNLFSGWDKDKIAVVCAKYLLENVDTTLCNTYYQLGHLEHKIVFPLNILKRKHFSGLRTFDDKKSTLNYKPGFRLNLIMRYFNPILKYLGLINTISKIKLSNNLCNWLNTFEPDIIYSQASNREGLQLISIIHSYLKKPLVFHMMDDWIVANKGPLKNHIIKNNDEEFRRLLNKCDILLSISEGMADEYKIRYGKIFITFHNPIDIKFWKKYQRNSFNLNEPPTILYAGRIGLGINKSLKLIAKSIQIINNDLKLSLKLVLQTKEIPRWCSKFNCVDHIGFVSYDRLPKIFASADFLILPYDFSLQSINFIRFSMPTKTTEYMISGTPIILFAPKETAIVKYAEKYKWAFIITNNQISSLCEGIKYLIQNNITRQQISTNAKRIAEENHESSKVRLQFREVICSLINTTNNKIIY
jgi:glycosyltransferase involved in cell wall biosynthesis